MFLALSRDGRGHMWGSDALWKESDSCLNEDLGNLCCV